MKRRTVRHIAFWLVYFSVNLFNELFLSASFNANPTNELFFKAFLAQLLILSVKIPAVYYTICVLIPGWVTAKNRKKLASEAIIVFACCLLLYRFMIHFIVWPFIYKEGGVTLTTMQLAARFLYSLLDLFQVTGIAAAIKLFRMRIEAARKEKALVQEKLHSEMLHLKAQINPHFLFNSLNSIFSLARMKSDETSSAVMRLSKLLRYMLYETGKSTTTLQDEIKIIEDYLELQQLRFGKRRVVQLEKLIDDYYAVIPPLIILPLVENAYKHGNNEGESTIYCKIALADNRLSVQIVNPVASLSVKRNGEEGIGLANIKRQLELLYSDYRFHYASRENVFVVDLYINLLSYAELELPDSGR